MDGLNPAANSRTDNFLKNFWYVAALSDEVAPNTLFNRVILNQPVVIYRKEDGTPVALEDRCCHKHYPLRKGRIEGSTIRCGYHGRVYSADGVCIDIPGQKSIPQNCRVRSYPLIERDTWIWIWMGDPSLADPADIGDIHWFNDPQWNGRSTVFSVQANFRLIVENLLDLTHVTFVHGTSIGNDANAYHSDDTVERAESEIRVKRWMMNVPPPPSYAKCGGFTTNIDRWQIVHYVPPAFIRIYTGGCVAGTGARGGNRQNEMGWMNLNSVTPETETTCHYFWGQCQNHDIGNQEMTDAVFNAVKTAFLEDVDVFSAQQRSLDMGAADSPEVLTSHDAAGVHANRMLDRLLKDQAAGGPATVRMRDLVWGPRD